MKSEFLAFFWHALAAALILIVGLCIENETLSTLSMDQAIALAIMSAAYLVAVVLTMTLRRSPGHSAPMFILVIFLCVYAFTATALFVSGAPIGIRVLAGQFVTALLLFALFQVLPRHRMLTFVGMGVVFLSAATFRFAGEVHTLLSSHGKPSSIETTYVPTVLYNVEATYYHDVVPSVSIRVNGHTVSDDWWGGAVTSFGEQYLLTTGDGRMFVFQLEGGGQPLQAHQLSLNVPINVADFVADAGDRVKLTTFRVGDVLVQEVDNKFRIFVSHHFWNSSEKCSVLRVSYLEGSAAEITAADPAVSWRTLFDTTPCLPFKDRAVRFGGLQIGGKMSFLSPDTILLTVGDHEFDGYYSKQNLSQSLDNSYGKTIRITISTGASELFSIGHRNPEGLVVDSGGLIWSTEHGPKAGDELNLLVSGGNYGWPLATYGTAYDKTVWPPSGDNFGHGGYVKPVFAWLPSIGVSDLTRIHGPEFKRWRDDLLIATLTDRKLWRLRVVDNHVIYAEPFTIGCRMRDIMQTDDGRFILWCDNENTLVFLQEPKEEDNGELLFATQCEGCHSLDNRENAVIGPDLRGTGQRKIASEPGFDYSAALERLGDRDWSEAELSEFLASPQKFAPGTSMNYAGLQDGPQREAIVKYLLSVKD